MKLAKAKSQWIDEANQSMLVSICPYCKKLNTNEHRIYTGKESIEHATICEHYRGILGGCGGNGFEFDNEKESLVDMHLEDKKIYQSVFKVKVPRRKKGDESTW